MALIRQYHKDTDTTYVYESESYWDPDKKQSRSRRKVVGKVDPETGEIIPTGKRGRKKKPIPSPASDVDTAEIKRISDQYEKAARTIAAKDQTIASLKENITSLKDELATLKEQNKALTSAIRKINAISENLSL